jgi:hypothetical protein
VITDDELLAAVRSAGEPGSESHREACRLYRRSVLEYQAQTAQGWRGHAARAALRLLIALAATEAIGAGWLDCHGCGTHDGYNKHTAGKTMACGACLAGERAYSRERKRAQARARDGQAWRAAA